VQHCVDDENQDSIPVVEPRRSKQKFKRAGFAGGVFAGVVFIAFKVLKSPGSIPRSDLLLALALILLCGLVGSLIGSALGVLFGSSHRDD
jgi:hypothetical protein